MPEATQYTDILQGIKLIREIYFKESVPKFLNISSNVTDLTHLLPPESDNIIIKSGSSTVYYNNFLAESGTRPTTTVGGATVLNTKELADINCVALIDDTDDNGKVLKAYMYNLYAWYDRCSALNYSKTTYNVKVPNSTSSPSPWSVPTGSKALTFSEADATNPVMMLSQVKNAFVTRRMLRLFIMLGNLQIAYKKGDISLVNDCYQLLRYTNVAIYGDEATADLTQTVGYNLNAVIQTRLNTYKQGQVRVSNIDKITSAHKNNLKQSKILLKQSADAHRRQMIVEAIALIAFIGIVAGAVSVVVYPMEQKSRYMGCLAVIALSIINALVMNALKSQGNVVEKFVGNVDVNYAVDEAVTYVQNTFVLANLLDTFRAVGNINYSMTREANYYNDAAEQLLNANLKVRSVYDISYSQDVKFSALINLLTSLSFVVAGMVTLYVSSDVLLLKYPNIQKYVIGLGAFIAIICLAIFMLEISTRVHTDPKKIYWAKPSNSLLP